MAAQGKGFKSFQVFGGFLIVVGFSLWAVSFKMHQAADFNMRPDDDQWILFRNFAVLAFVSGAVIYLGARLADWWSSD